MNFVPKFYAPSGIAATNIMPFSSVIRNRDAIRYYQRVLIAKFNDPASREQPLTEDGSWGPITQRYVASYQQMFNRDFANGRSADLMQKYGVARRLRADGILDEDTQRVLQVVGEFNRVPRGSFAANRTAVSTTPRQTAPQLAKATPFANEFVETSSVSPDRDTPATFTERSVGQTSTLAPQVAAPQVAAPQVAAPQGTSNPATETSWGTVAIVGGIVIAAALVTLQLTRKNRR